jgi:hypothetical protein
VQFQAIVRTRDSFRFSSVPRTDFVGNAWRPAALRSLGSSWARQDTRLRARWPSSSGKWPQRITSSLSRQYNLSRQLWVLINVLTGQVPTPLVRLPDFHDRSLSRGQKLSRRASEERGYKTLSDFSPRVLASQPWFLFQIEPDFHLLSQTSEWS